MRKNMKRLWFARHLGMLAVFIYLAVAGSTVNAQITYQTADRAINASASGFCNSASDSDSSTAVGNFSESVGAHADTGGDISICQANATGSATQMTDLQTWSIGGQGRASSDAAFGGNSSADSTMSVDFSVSSPFAYTLSGTVSGQFDEFFPVFSQQPGDARVTLSDGSGVVHEAQQTTTTDLPFSFSGVLSPGTYTLNAMATTSAYSDSQHVEAYSFQFTGVPEPSSGLLLVGLLVAVLPWRIRRR